MDCLYYMENVGRFDLAYSNTELVSDIESIPAIGEMQCVESGENQGSNSGRNAQWNKHKVLLLRIHQCLLNRV
jgi:hypothetical protein